MNLRRWAFFSIMAGWVLGCTSLSAWAEDIAQRIGNPLLARYPLGGDARPRSIWDLHFFNGRLYLGNGDYWMNRGPIDVWTYAGNGTNFVNEYTVNDEMAWDFFEFEGKLFIPGYDARETSPDIANLYINDPERDPGPGWLKRRTLTGGVHSMDVALFQGRLFASMTLASGARTMMSTNMGQTWATLLNQYSALMVFDDFLFFEGTQDYVYDGAALRTVTPTTFLTQMSMARRARFQAGLLYSFPVRYNLTGSPLYYLTPSQITNGSAATVVPAFTNQNVRDIVVRGDVCYVMTAQEIQRDALYRGFIYASSDLTNWPLASEFTVPGLPLSFEIMSNKFYVGLGSRFDGSNWNVLIGPEAGSLWQITPAPQLANLDPLVPGEVTLDIAVVPGFPFTIESTPDLVAPAWTHVISTNSTGDTYRLTDPVQPNAPIRYYRIFH